MQKQRKLKTKLLLIVILPVLISTGIAVLVAAINLKQEGYTALESKSTAILSRMEAVRSFTAQQNMAQLLINKMLQEHQNGELSNYDKELIKNQVPIIASWKIGYENAAADDYVFTVVAENPRNQEHKATEQEIAILNQFKINPNQTIIQIDNENNRVNVMRAVLLSSAEGCLNCHGSPDLSPYKNGNDILGYKMENFSNKQLMGMFVISSDLKPLQKRINKAVLIIVLWGVIIAVVALFFSIFFIDKINSNIKNITKVTEKVARKDLNVKVKIVSNDELGDLADNINLMIDALHAVITDVNKSAKILSKSSFGISSITNQISDNAQQQATQLEQLNSSIQTTAQSSHLASVITGQKVATALQLDVNIEKSVNTMSDIQKSSKKIENALKIIFEIAAQTNMLAINAAVEAAIAGQNGKGFAVVASEVKSLADKTKKYTKEISEIISTNNSQVESGVKMLKEVREAIKGIVEGIQTIAAELDAISNNTKEQAITMEENSKLTAINANATEQVAFSAKNLSENAANLYQLIDSFTLK